MHVSLCHTSAKPFFHGGTLMKFMDMYLFFYSMWVLGYFSKLTRKNIGILTKTSCGPRAGSDQKLPDVDEKWSYQAKKCRDFHPSHWPSEKRIPTWYGTWTIHWYHLIHLIYLHAFQYLHLSVNVYVYEGNIYLLYISYIHCIHYMKLCNHIYANYIYDMCVRTGDIFCCPICPASCRAPRSSSSRASPASAEANWLWRSAMRSL